MGVPGLIAKLDHCVIHVSDWSVSNAFYRDVLGLKLLFTAGQLAFFDCDGVRLMLSPPSSPEYDHPSSILYFKVDDIQSAHRRLLQLKVKTEGEPHMVARMPDHELWLTGFRDSEGNVMEFMAEVRRS